MSSASRTDLALLAVSEPISTVQVVESIIPSLLSHFLEVMQRHVPPRNDDKAQVDRKAGDSSHGRIQTAKSLPVESLSDRSATKKKQEKELTRRRSCGEESIDHSLRSDSNHELGNQIERLYRDLGYIKDALDRHRKAEDNVSQLIKELVKQSKDAAFLDSPQTPGAANGNSEKIQVQLSDLTEIVTKLKLNIPLPTRYRPRPPMPTGAHKWPMSLTTLDIRSKQCLLCFAVFPEHAEIKKRFLYYWWVGEGLIDPSNSEDKSVGDILEDLVDKGFIQPVVKKRRMVTTSKRYKMLPLIRSMVVILAKEAKFFDFDSRGCPTAKFSECLRSCLVRSKEASWQKEMADPDMEKLRTLVNVNEPYLDFKVDWFSNMKNINCLSLGSWRGSKKDHIEVENTEFLRGMKCMKHLKFFSLQGISRITELPGSIGKLYNLRILDLRACHNLESLPDEICSLKELTNLDVSGCYLLEYMPKGLGSLVKLEVLMGFVVSDLKSGSYCTVNDLAKLKKLRKLGFRTGRKSFPTEKELRTLQEFNKLRKLTIAWGEDSVSEKVEGAESADDDLIKSKCFAGLFLFTKRTAQNPTTDDPKLPKNLEKLDLICYPSTTPPTWLMPEKLENLKTLYVRGGYLSSILHPHHLGQVEEDKKWKVKTMRLKYLNELTMDWREMRQSFPDLVCLHMVDCPRLTLFPCDKNGVWLKEQFLKAITRD
ncbi:hypothetical protein NL676_011446 [Syzygium grande]|nr:hypothetical protein NL676_011446 [Syzygium grande]